MLMLADSVQIVYGKVLAKLGAKQTILDFVQLTGAKRVAKVEQTGKVGKLKVSGLKAIIAGIAAKKVRGLYHCHFHCAHRNVKHCGPRRRPRAVRSLPFRC